MQLKIYFNFTNYTYATGEKKVLNMTTSNKK